MQNITPNFTFDLTKVSKKEQIEYAEMFSEGSQQLEDLLVFMWGKKINTFACCAGHSAKTSHSGNEELPYIFFDISTLKERQIERLIKLILMQTDKNIKAKFHVDTFNGERHSLSIRYTKKNPNAIKNIHEIIATALGTAAISEEYKTWLKTSKIAKKLTEETISHFIKTVISINLVNLTKYQKLSQNKGKSFGKIDFLIQDKLEISTMDNLQKCLIVIKNDQNEIEEHYHIVKGYVTITNDGDYLTWASDNSLVELSKSEAKKYPQYLPDENYNFVASYSTEKADAILNEIVK